MEVNLFQKLKNKKIFLDLKLNDIPVNNALKAIKAIKRS